MLALSIRWFGENTKINKEAVVQVVLQRMWFDTTNSNKKHLKVTYLQVTFDSNKIIFL